MFIDKVVIPFLQANDLEFIKGKGELLVLIRGRQRLDMTIRELAKPAALQLIGENIIDFNSDDARVPKLLDELNQTTHVKWIAEADGTLRSVFFVLIHDGLDEKAFEAAFDCAAITSLMMQKFLLEVRYGNKSLKAAADSWTKRIDGKRRKTDTSRQDVDRLLKEALGDE